MGWDGMEFTRDLIRDDETGNQEIYETIKFNRCLPNSTAPQVEKLVT